MPFAEEGVVESSIYDNVGSLQLASTVLLLPSGEAEKLVAKKSVTNLSRSKVIVLSAESAHVPINPVYTGFLSS